jgi:hypothetical protein
MFESKETAISALNYNIHSNVITVQNYDLSYEGNLDTFFQTYKNTFLNAFDINIHFCYHGQSILILSKEKFFHNGGDYKINELWQVMVGEKIGWMSICDYIMFEEVK